MPLQRISDLTAGTPPYSGASLVEVSVPTGSSPPFASRKALLSDVSLQTPVTVPNGGMGSGTHAADAILVGADTAAIVSSGAEVSATGDVSGSSFVASGVGLAGGLWWLGTSATQNWAWYADTGLARLGRINASFALVGDALRVDYATGAVQLAGTATNDSAAAGFVGEYRSGTAALAAKTSGVAANVTSVALTAGDWDVEGTVWFSAAGTTVTTALTVGLTTASATFGAQGTFGRTDMYGINMAGLNMQLFSGRVRISLAASGTAYLNCLATFTTSTLQAAGMITARRVR